jgi:formiminotetrahydrofolate cyclodeaminase
VDEIAGMPSRTSYLGRGLGEFLDLVAAREAAPGGGAVTAVTVSLAAGLVAMAARLSERQLPDSTALADEADRIRRRAADLAGEDADAYRAVIAASTEAATRHSAGWDGDDEVRSAFERASAVPLEITTVGARTATLGARLAAEGNPRLRGDAATAVLLAEAAVRSAAELVRINVTEGDGPRTLVVQAERNLAQATDALRAVSPSS